MVSKLSFKGERPKKKKIVKRVVKRAGDSPQPEVDPGLIETSWTSAIEFADLNGPLMITTISRTGQDFLQDRPIALASGSDGSVVTRRDLSTLSTPVNFPSKETDSLAYSALIHKSEPSDIQQVFIAVSLSALVKGMVHPNRTKLALKNAQDKYLGIDEGGIDCRSDAISDAQMFEFEKVVRPQEGIYFRLIHGEEKLVLEDGTFKLVAIDNEGSNDLFIIRVQAKNSVEGQRILREQQKKKIMGGDSVTHAVKQGIESLQKFGIEVNNAIVTRLRNAAINGKINEQLVLEKQMGKSDSRC